MPRASYHVVTIQPPGASWVKAFDDIATLLKLSFESLGLACTVGINTFEASSVNVVLAYHLLRDPAALRGLDCVIYQLEQLPNQGQDWLALTEDRLATLRQAREVWDYSVENIELLRSRGVGRVKLLPFGFHEGLRVIEEGESEADIDVLFYGAINARRKAVLGALSGRCLVKSLFGAYGARRDGHVARSKIVLNVHQHPALLMEQPRVSYLLNNRRFVISEGSADDPYAGALVTAPYDGLVDCCLRYLDLPEERARMAAVGYDFLAARPMTDYLRAVLD